MRSILIICGCLILSMAGMAQGPISKVDIDQIPASYRTLETLTMASTSSTYRINYSKLMNDLDPMSSQALRFSFPIDHDQMAEFLLEEDSPMHPKLQAKFPEIRTFSGKSLDELSTLSITYSPYGVHASLRNAEGLKYFVPVTEGDPNFGILFNRSDYTGLGESPFYCGNDELPLEEWESPISHLGLQNESLKAGEPISLRKYRMAVACVSEFTTFKGG
ncbi:MAG: hypothetical protein HKN16_05320, partial [Saprospiraceae bacterium]|nr:hypothetical protein [Saprospiraceae bacterium]